MYVKEEKKTVAPKRNIGVPETRLEPTDLSSQLQLPDQHVRVRGKKGNDGNLVL